MLLGEHDHSLDEKNRLTLPAKLRGAFEDGVFVTRGLDGCLFAYPREAWDHLAERIRSLDPLAEGSRVMQRHFFAGAAQGELDKQGRVVIPANLLEQRGDRPRGHGGRRLRPPGDLGPREVASTAPRSRRERGRCCRASCQLSPTTSRSSPRRFSPSSTRARARPSSTAPSAPAATRCCSPRSLRGDGKLIAIDRDPDRCSVLRALPPRDRREGSLAPRRVLDRPAAPRRQRRQGRRDPARPRRLVDAARPARPRLLVRRRRAARHAHGPERHVLRA